MDEKIISTEKIYTGRVINLDVHKVLLPNGMEQVRELVRHPGATAVVAVDNQGLILIVRQFRIAAGKVMIEIPAGTLHAGERPLDCAIRELQEETGFKPGHIESLGGFFVAPGYTTEYIHLHLATDLSESKLPGDDDEFIQVQHISLQDALSMIERGEIVDGKTIIGVLRYARQKMMG